MDDGPRPHVSTWHVWTDVQAYANTYGGRDPRTSATWFWTAAGPRGFESGAEGTSDAATNRAMAACALLRGTHEK